MNELFILGELMEGPHSGYQLRSAMQVSLGRHRKISFGVVYPLLEKLAKAGLIELTSVPEERNKNMASITDKGRERFFQLMEQPVPDGAHNADIYLIKLDVMQHLPLIRQRGLLDEFCIEQNAIIEETRKAINDLRREERIDHWYAEKKQELRLRQASIAIQWAEDFRQELNRMT